MSYTEFMTSKYVNRGDVYVGDKVRISFTPNKKGAIIMRLYIGKDLLKRLGWEAGDRCIFLRDEDVPLVWVVKKSTALHGKKLNDPTAGSGRAPSLLIQHNWREPIPESCKGGIKFVSHDFFEGGLRLALPGTRPGDLSL
jgi:bifunctional DNA-binding transcriptional regulator/antitoxin component of YhaV-PrlF toxin-antitoxin module